MKYHAALTLSLALLLFIVPTSGQEAFSEDCIDGTPNQECSVVMPLFCDRGILVNRCDQCGCLENQLCSESGECTGYEYQSNEKDPLKYHEREVFLIPDSDWRDVMALVPATTWTSNMSEEHQWCTEKGIVPYGGAPNVCSAPMLIYHTEGDAFDADPIIRFMQNYDAESVTILGEPTQELLNIISSPPGFGAGIPEDNISVILPENIFSYWKSFNKAVYVEEDYEHALLASAFASLVNAPLVIENSEFGLALQNRHVICVGSPSGECDEQYTLEQLRQRYIDMTGTDKIIMTNPEDIETSISGSTLSADKSEDIISELYRGTSLVSPILASAKHQVIFTTNETDYISVDADFEDFYEDTFSSARIVCRPEDPCSSGFMFMEDYLGYRKGNVSYHADGFSPDNHIIYIYAIMFGDDADSLGRFNISLYNNGELVDYGMRYGESKYFDGPEYLHTHYQSAIMFFQVPLSPGTIEVRGNGVDFYFSTSGGKLYDIDYGASVCTNINDTCAPDNYQIIKKSGMYSTGNSSFFFPGTGSSLTNFGLEISVSMANYFNIYINGHLLDTVKTNVLRPQDFKFEYFVPSYMLEDNNTITLEHFSDTGRNPKYSAEVTVNSYPARFLTIIGGPQAIQYRLQMDDISVYDNYKALDQAYYGDMNANGIPELNTGRIDALTVSGASSQIARYLFYDDMRGNSKTKFMSTADPEHTGYNYVIPQVGNWSDVFGQSGYDSHADIHEEHTYSFDPQEWHDQHMISYSDHGNYYWAGIYHSSIPELDSSLVFNDACSTCSRHISSSFCHNAIRMGALAHMGACTIGWTNTRTYMDTMNKLFYDNIPLGEAFTSSFINDRYRWMVTLLGDPTFQLNPEYFLQEELRWYYG